MNLQARIERLERNRGDNGAWLFVVAGTEDAEPLLRLSGYRPTDRDLIVHLPGIPARDGRLLQATRL